MTQFYIKDLFLDKFSKNTLVVSCIENTQLTKLCTLNLWCSCTEYFGKLACKKITINSLKCEIYLKDETKLMDEDILKKIFKMSGN